LLCLLLLLSTITVAQAQFTFTTNNGAITITRYTGPGGAVTIPAETNGFPVTAIAGGKGAFSHTAVSSVMIPDSVTNIGDEAFIACANLTSLMIPKSVTSIGSEAFNHCTGLTNIEFPGVISIGVTAFYYCTNLTYLRMPQSIVSIGGWVFYYCPNLRGVLFEGNAPGIGVSVFDGDTNATIYYLPGTTGWGSTFGGRPTAQWFLSNPLILDFEPSFGIHTNQFCFVVSWATNISVIVDACMDLASNAWQPVQTNALINGSANFSDPDWTNYPARFYRIRSP
jgi:hypothetical protein